MFKSLSVFQIAAPLRMECAAVEAALRRHAFAAGSVLQEKCVGWAPPRGGEHEPYLEAIGGHWLAMFKIETRSVPAEALRARVAALTAEVQAKTGRKPGRRESKIIKDDARAQLLSKAFAKTALIPVWIDVGSGRVGVGSATQGKLDDVISSLIRSVDGLVLQEHAACRQVAVAMREWLLCEDDERMPEGMSLGNQCELRQEGEGRATARFTNQNLDCEEVRQNLRVGKQPLSLGLVWKDRVELVLMSSGRIKSLRLPTILDCAADEQGCDDFDVSFTLFASEMSKVVSQLYREIGSVWNRVEQARAASDATIRGIASMWADPVSGKAVCHPEGGTP